MKTLILNGSPRSKGDTASLISIVRENIVGECRIVDAYRCNISPCVDCRFCRQNEGCAIQDEMQELYGYIEECDNILIASPVYFSELTGRLLDVGSRLQTYFCRRHFQNKEPIAKTKKGAVILVGGGDGKMKRAYETAGILLRHMKCDEVYPLVFSHDTDNCPAVDDAACIEGVKEIISFFNRK